MAVDAGELAQIQQWFQAAIMDPGKQAARLPEIVLPSQALNATERLAIYANMYFDRLIEILAEEFPTVRHLLGPQVFSTVAKDYVTRHPSTHYSLAQLGKKFPRFLREETDAAAITHRPFTAAVAMVERTMEDVFDERQDEPLTVEALQAIKPDRWDELRLRTIAALRLLQLPCPVNDYISAVRDGRSIDMPAMQQSFVVVYRRNYRVWRQDLDEPQFVLLAAIQEGRSLGDAVSACVELPGSDPESLAASLFDWFRDWTAEGFFREIDSTATS